MLSRRFSLRGRSKKRTDPARIAINYHEVGAQTTDGPRPRLLNATYDFQDQSVLT